MSLRSFFAELVASPRSRAQALNRDAVALLNREKWDDALARLNEALSIDPGIDMAYINRATVWGKKNDWQAMIADCEAALRLSPALVSAYVYLSTAKLALGDHPAALADANQSLRHGNWAAALYNRANVYAAMNDPDRALADFSEAIRLEPSLADAWLGRAKIWKRKNDHRRAVDDLDRAIELRRRAGRFSSGRAVPREGARSGRDRANAGERTSRPLPVAPALARNDFGAARGRRMKPHHPSAFILLLRFLPASRSGPTGSARRETRPPGLRI